MVAIKCYGTPEWADQVDELAVRLGLSTRSAVLERAIGVLAKSQGLNPVSRNEPSKFTPIVFRSRGPLPGQTSFDFANGK